MKTAIDIETPALCQVRSPPGPSGDDFRRPGRGTYTAAFRQGFQIGRRLPFRVA